MKKIYRTYKDRNAIIIKNTHAEILLYKSRKEQIEIARAIISLNRVELIKKYKWHLTEYVYVRTFIEKKGVFLHDLIINPPKGFIVDHRNRNRLDNLDNNLRIVSKQQNAINSKIPINNTSGIKGVSWDTRKNKWRAYIKVREKHIFLGYYEDINDAKEARYRGNCIILLLYYQKII